MEAFKGSIDVRFADMPDMVLESYKSKENEPWYKRLAKATKRRKFSLRQDWVLQLGSITYLEEANGAVKIPARNEHAEHHVFDGASIPLPWLVSLLTVGVLRPLGVVLVGSIVHDFAFQNGFLWVKREGDTDYIKTPLARHCADYLFRDIVNTVNRLPIFGTVAWFFIRLGWPFIAYNGKRRTGDAPVKEYGLFFMMVIALCLLIAKVGALAVLVVGAIGYFILFGLSVLVA